MKKTIVISPEQVAIEANLRPGKAKDKPWRPYIAERFLKEHGVVVVDFTKLRYFQDEYGRGTMEVTGEIGAAISAPIK